MGRDRNPLPRRSAYITPEGERALRAELQHLWKDERPQVTATVQEAAKNGDRSENGDYIYGKRRLREIDRRVRYLGKRLEQLTVVAQPPADRGRVYFGARVTVEDESGQQQLFHIVGPDEFDLSAGRLSVDSPMARAMLGKRVDDVFRASAPAGERSYCIVAIAYGPP